MSEELKSHQEASQPQAERPKEKSVKDTISELEENKNQYYKGICYQLWTQPQIHADGKILGCCSNFWGDFGSVFDFPTLLEAINNDKIRYARKMLAGIEPEKEGIPCTDCHHWKVIRDMKNWVTQDEINSSY
ncbi:MAG: hypothetical protein H6624_18995 [Bdellovibrionaceae bacterium]|nr:hypothetical protein [Bdellovibrionales bacterium]MCB9086435.1 hypothetical protein [Pseudobdellovibrionaceae bacterium]